MKRMVLLFVCLAFMPAAIQAGELFRWTDREGKVHYSDTPPADGTTVERKKLSGDVSQNEDLPYETRRAQENFPVTLYVMDGCGAPCNQARSLLNKRGIPFSEKTLKTQAEVDEFHKLSGSNGVPTLEVGTNYLGGFLESKWNSELDVAGYPKTASYRQRLLQSQSANPEAPQKPLEQQQSTPAESAQ
jgi:glutaredoxin